MIRRPYNVKAPVAHGTRSGYQKHLRRLHDKPCPECTKAEALYRQNHRYGTPEMLRNHPAKCGTTGGYDRHLDQGEPTCDKCRRAHANYRRAWKKRKQDSQVA